MTAQYPYYKRLVIVMAGLLISSIIVTFALLLVGLTDRADTASTKGDQRSKILQRQSKVLEHVDACLTINTPCYNSNLRRTSGILSTVFEQDIAIATCTDQPGEQSEKQIRKCAEHVIQVSREARSQSQ